MIEYSISQDQGNFGEFKIQYSNLTTAEQLTLLNLQKKELVYLPRQYSKSNVDLFFKFVDTF